MPISSKLIKDSRITVGTKKHYRGAAPYPYTPAKGDTWDELDVNNNWIESWFWNGTYWLSIQTFHHEYSTVTTTTTVPSVTYLLSPAWNVFITNLYANILTSTLGDAANNWGWSVRTINSAGTTTTLATANSIGQAANSWVSYFTPVNLHVAYDAVNRVALRTLEVRTGTPNKQGTIGFHYKKARL